MSLPEKIDPSEEELSVGVDLISKLEGAGVLTSTRLDLSARPDLSVEICMAMATFFGRLNSSTRWWIADLYRYVDMRHGEYVAQVMEATGLAESTIEGIVSTGLRVPPERRNPRLHFSHHVEVAALPPEEQVSWLHRAERERMTRADLRAHLRPKELPPAIEPLICPHCGNEVPQYGVLR